MKINNYGTVELDAYELQKFNEWKRADVSRQEMTWQEAAKLYISENEENE